MTEQRHYTHSIVSYASLEELRRLLEQARAWAYIKHDKDVDEQGKLRAPHYHIIATFSQQKSFKWIRNQVISTQNTFAEAVKGEVSDVLDYFTHKGIAEKYQYPDTDVVYSDREYWERRTQSCGTSKEDANEAFVDDLLSDNYNAVAMARKYGRDFIKNIKSYEYFRGLALGNTRKITQAEQIAQNVELALGVNEFGEVVDGQYTIINGQIAEIKYL